MMHQLVQEMGKQRKEEMQVKLGIRYEKWGLCMCVGSMGKPGKGAVGKPGEGGTDKSVRKPANQGV